MPKARSLCFAAALVCITASPAAGQISLAEKLDLLRAAYPQTIKAHRANTLILQDGTTLLIDDGRRKTHQEKLKTADIEDMLAQIYPVGPCVRGHPAQDFDPGRIRNQPLLHHLFGHTKSDVGKALTAIRWFSTKLSFTTRQGAAQALSRVAKDLAQLPKPLQQFVRNPAGTFNWRPIAGTNRLSVHSFAAAIDINLDRADYWRWSGAKPGNVPRFRNRIPVEIADVFERHGFIWGGRWYHYDTMHFEYRPELIAIGRLAAKRGCPTS